MKPNMPDNSTSSPGSATGELNEDDGSVELYDDSTSDHSIETEVEEASDSDEGKRLDSDFEDKAVSCFRFFVLFILVFAMAGAGAATWHFMTKNQYENFYDEFGLIAESIAQESSQNIESIVADSKSMSSTLTAIALNNGTEWPFFEDSSFQVIGRNFRESSSADTVAITPLVNSGNKLRWESFAIDNQDWIEEGLKWEGVATSAPIQSIPVRIYRRGIEGEIIEDVGPGPYAPMWEMSVAPTDPYVINYDTLSDPTFGRVFSSVQSTAAPVLSDLVNPVDFFGSTAQTEEPTSLLVYPVTGNFETNSQMVATLVGSFRWTSFFSMPLHKDDHPAIVVVDDSCGVDFTLRVAEETQFVGYGDHHDSELDEYVQVYDFAPFLETEHNSQGTDCAWTIHIYPGTAFAQEHLDQKPQNMTIVVVFVFFSMSIIFCLYDCAVHSRQRRILKIAAQSERILSILYPKQIRDRLFGQHTAEEAPAEETKDTKETSSKKKRKKSHADPTKNAKYQLKTFMNEDGEGAKVGARGPNEPFGDKPIADLFPHTTVMFADIAGFTAWSSVREPSQVFTLLETVYHAFDVIAKRRRVFKVETVGDCYVAVTGLPEPRKDHALAMARFSRECVSRFNDLVGQLETTLGPDTGDLAVRVGLHSGPVTAGVLRGDKSRFQLFGDTVNTAARIESTGKRNRIHVSMETAELLQHSAKGHWLKRREQQVEAKGKGKLQTYWLLLKDDASGCGLSVGDLSGSDGEGSDGPNDNQAATPIPQEITRGNNLKAQCADDVELPPKIERLVKWNVDVLTRLLKQVVAKRNAMGVGRNLDMALTQKEGEIRKKFMVLDEVVETISLPGFDHHIYRSQEDPNSIELPSEVVEQMRLYVTMIAVMYRDNSFHNFEHASHVMMSVSKLLSRITAADDLWNANEDATKSKDFGFSLHDHTYGITSDPMTQFSVVLAALIHDVDHLGVSNFQLIKEDHKLAKLFKSKSVAEQNSVVLAWDTLMDPRFYDLRRTIYADPFELERFRQLVANTVLATDIFDKELQSLRKNRWEIAFSIRPADSVSTKDDINRKATIVIEHLIQASDVAHTMQHWHIYRKWNERLFAEMITAYQSGRMEKNPADFWYEGELGFFDNYIIPLAKKLKDCGVFGVSSDEYLNYALENRREWANNGEDVLRSLIEKYQPPTTPTPEIKEEQPTNPTSLLLNKGGPRPTRRASLR